MAEDLALRPALMQAYRFALDPSPAQERQLRSHCGAARVAYNALLAEIRENLETVKAEKAEIGEQRTPYLSWTSIGLQNRWNQVLREQVASWWRENPDNAYRTGYWRLAQALSNWKRSRAGNRAGERVGFPRFRSRRHLSVSYWVSSAGGVPRVEPDGRHVRVPRMEPIRLHERADGLLGRVRAGDCRIKQATVTRDSRGRWNISFIVERSSAKRRPAHARVLRDPSTGSRARVIGVALGVRDLVTLATPEGMEIPPPVAAQRSLARNLERLALLQRHLARKTKGSNRRRSAAERVARLHGQIAAERDAVIDRTATWLAQSGSTIEFSGTTLNFYANTVGGTSGNTYYGATLVDLPAGENLMVQATYADGSPVRVTVMRMSDGAVFTATNSGASGPLNLPAATPIVRIGANEALTGFFDGRLQEVSWYGTKLSDERLAAHRRAALMGGWGDGTTIYPSAITYEIDDQDLISTATVQLQHILDSEPEQVIFGFSRSADRTGGRAADSILIPAGGQYGPFESDYARPILTLSAPVAGENYTANSAIDGTGTDLTADLEVPVTDLGAGFRGLIRNTGATPAYITKFELEGLPLDVALGSAQFVTNKPIPGNKTDMGVTIFVPFGDDGAAHPVAQDYSHALASRYRWPYPRLTLDFDVSSDAKKSAFLALEVGDLVYYSDTGLGVDQTSAVIAGSSAHDWYYVETMRFALDVPQGGRTFEMSVTLIPSWLYRNLDRIAYDLFEREDASGSLGTSLSNDAWANDSGFDIAGNAARANTDTESRAVLDLGPLAFDHVVEVDLSEIGSGDEVGVVFGGVDDDNEYRLYVDEAASEVILEKQIATAVTEIASPAYTVGSESSLRVLHQGSRIRAWVGRRLYIDVDDSALNTGTKVGLFARNAAGTTKFHRFYAEGL